MPRDAEMRDVYRWAGMNLPGVHHMLTCMHVKRKRYLHAGSHEDAECSSDDESGGVDNSSSSSDSVGPLKNRLVAVTCMSL